MLIEIIISLQLPSYKKCTPDFSLIEVAGDRVDKIIVCVKQPAHSILFCSAQNLKEKVVTSKVSLATPGATPAMQSQRVIGTICRTFRSRRTGKIKS